MNKQHTNHEDDDEEFCDVCFAGTESDEHLTQPCGESDR